MKTSNKYIIRFFNILNLVILALIVLNIIMYTDSIFHLYDDIVPPYVITGIIVVLIYITSRTGNQSFTIDTKGETITFETRNIGFLSFIDSNKNKIDLPKYKLINYEYEGGLITKELIFYINSKNRPSLTKRRFRLAFVSKENIDSVIRELETIVEANREVKNNLEVAI